MKNLHEYVFPALFLHGLVFCVSVNAVPRIMILDFELNDITSLPNTPEELVRTASIKPLLEQAMLRQGAYEIIPISLDEQKRANSGFGYLFQHYDSAAKLAKQFGADWIIVGQHSKPSFLFSDLMVHVIDVKNNKFSIYIDIGLKGNHEKVTNRSVKRLAQKISKMIFRRVRMHPL